MREDAEHFLPRYEWAYRLFAAAPGQRFPDRKLHFAPVPTDIPVARYVKTTLRIQHYGELTATHRLQRFAKYLEADHDQGYGFDYGTILRTPPGLQLRPWEPRPEGMPVLMAEVQAGGADALALSVIVIAQNDESTIAASIAAIVGQDCPETFEVILVASGTDRTAAIVRASFPTVTVVELPKPALPGEARNAGLRVARGTYVTFPGSHVTIAPGSLKARLRAHRRGYAMVTGVTENGTRTPVGWASYFLDQSDGLPGQGPAEINGPPAHCSYARLPLLEVGGFPEGVRTAEDTAVNRALVGRGYVALRDPQIRFVHHSPCRTWSRLVRHHFKRGRGWGRLLVERHQESGHLLNRDVIRTRLVRHIPERLARVAHGVSGATPELQAEYDRVRAGVALGAVASWTGMWVEILRPAPARWSILTGQPHQTILFVATGNEPCAHLTDIDRARRQVTTIGLAPPGPLSPGIAPSSAFQALRDTFGGQGGIELVVAEASSLTAPLPVATGSPSPVVLTSPANTLGAMVSVWRGLRGGRLVSTLSPWSLADVIATIRASTKSTRP